jgi:hypothetical protein
MSRHLPKHDEYMQKLEIFAEASRIEVVWEKEPDGGAWIPTRRMIRIDPHLSDAVEVATFLHELGHSEDDSFLCAKAWRRLDRAYRALKHEREKPRHARIILECEERAWRLGRAIAKRLKIPLGKWFDEEEQSSLAMYRERFDQ